MIELNDFLTDRGHYSNGPCWWNFEFPSGASANVELSSTPFRFDVEVDQGDNDMVTLHGQTTEQVEERLRELAALPAAVAS
ncbi:hypothetical protein GCM10010172_07400 [Paractinoplanes ferrugineus]|uniref:Uncharacterized protein n=1 Tax=Paractinoplanes ferrugineus TaxID=113564 RepID=A0A919J8G9_9ACTN|nr:hypothetical protein [Actinoplanes ferrugineus]GIE16781.1 hypothetical protein Afe05nite_86210 [Actinoplanes ferrugineus]